MKKNVLVILIILFLAGCAQGNDAGNETEVKEEVATETEATEQETEDPKEFEAVTIVDAEGREVTIEEEVEKVVCIGPGALRLYTYINGSEKLAGVEEIEMRPDPKKPYLIAYPEIMELDIIGPGGPKNVPDAELLSSAQADVIFSLYGEGKDSLDELEAKTASKVIGLSMGVNSVFEEDLYQSLENIGKVMNKTERAEELINYMKGIQKDLNDRTIDAKSPPVYIGGIGYRGAQGILSSRAHFALLQNIHANNILDDLTEERNIMLDKEKLLELNPEIIFLDLDGEELIEEDMKMDTAFYEKLQAFKNGTAYAIIPYNNYHTNVDTAMIDMYYMGGIIHPEGFEDIKIEDVAKEIYTTLLGVDCFPKMQELYPKGLKVFEIVK